MSSIYRHGDLISRLRATANIAPETDGITKLRPEARDMLREAADEIERLSLRVIQLDAARLDALQPE